MWCETQISTPASISTMTACITHAEEIAAIGEDGRRQDEVERQVMHRHGGGGDQDRPPVAERRQHGERREEVHMHVDLPGMAVQRRDQGRDRQHHGGGLEIADGGPAHGKGHGAGRERDHRADAGGDAGHAVPQPVDEHDQREVQADEDAEQPRGLGSQ